MWKPRNELPGAMSKERRIGFGDGPFATERAELSATEGGGVPLEGQMQVSEGTERPKNTRAKSRDTRSHMVTCRMATSRKATSREAT